MLLLFIILVLNVSLAVKLGGLVFIFIARRDVRLGLLKGRLPLFYPIIIMLSLFQVFLHIDRGVNYVFLALLSCFFWISALLASHQLKLAIERNGIEKVEKTLGVFFILNAIVSAGNLLRIMYDIETINPYSYDGFNFKYSASTGDYIKGLTNDISTTNMIINSFGIFYFLYRRKYFLSALCYVVAMYTTSNLGNFLLLFLFLSVLAFDRSKLHKSVSLCYVAFMFVFIIKISPSNLHYLNVKTQQLLHLDKRILSTNWDDQSEKDKLIDKFVNRNHKKEVVKRSNREIVSNLMVETEIHKKEQMEAEDKTAISERNVNRARYVDYYCEYYGDTLPLMYTYYYNRYPGKYLSFVETINYSKENVSNFLLGAGGGAFSSKLAYKATNMGFSGKYINDLKYISPEFRDNHLKLSLSYYVQSPDEHSILNFPNSVFNQLLGEYGMIGLIAFLIFYLWFFLKRFRSLTFGKILLPTCLFFLMTDYWFESFSIVIIFELMMYIDLAGSSQTNKFSATND